MKVFIIVCSFLLVSTTLTKSSDEAELSLDEPICMDPDYEKLEYNKWLKSYVGYELCKTLNGHILSPRGINGCCTTYKCLKYEKIMKEYNEKIIKYFIREFSS